VLGAGTRARSLYRPGTAALLGEQLLEPMVAQPDVIQLVLQMLCGAVVLRPRRQRLVVLRACDKGRCDRRSDHHAERDALEHHRHHPTSSPAAFVGVTPP
jgi:hypothetical protein